MTKRVLSRALKWGIPVVVWWTLGSTIAQVGWTAYVFLWPGWESWRTRSVLLGCAGAIVWCAFKLGGLRFVSKWRALRSSTAAS